MKRKIQQYSRTVMKKRVQLKTHLLKWLLKISEESQTISIQETQPQKLN